MENLITFTKDVTTFSISILETGWIYDVFLILTDEMRSKYEEGEFRKIKANHMERKEIDQNTYSVFEAYYEFEQPFDSMVYFFIFSIEGVTYVTDPTYFTVEDY